MDKKGFYIACPLLVIYSYFMNDEKITIWKQQIRDLQNAYSLAMDHGKYEYFDDIFLEEIQALSLIHI